MEINTKCLHVGYHRPGGTSMMACENIVKEDQDFGTVESQRKPATPFGYLLSYALYLRHKLPKIIKKS